MGISIANVVKQSAKFNVVQVIAQLILIPRSIIIAMVLFPEDYGIIAFLSLWPMYAGLINPGIHSAGGREMVYLLGKDEKDSALRIQNIYVTGDLVYSILPFLVILFASFFFHNPVVRVGLVITSVSFALGCILSRWSGVNFARQKFTLVAKGRLINAISSVSVVLILIWWLKVYAVLLTPIFCSIVVGIYYWKKGPIGYRFQFDLSEIKRLAKVGIVLALGTLAFWGYKMVDRTIIAAKLPLAELGLYAYAMTFIMLGWRFFIDFGNVLQPILWEHSGKVKSTVEAFSDTKRIAIYLAVITAVIIPLSQLCFYLLVNIITKKYTASIPIFYVLSYNFFLASLAIIPSIILTSKIISMQKITTTLYWIGLGLNTVFDLLVIRLGYGVIGIAWVTIITQGLVTFLLYVFVRKYVFVKIREFFFFLLHILIPFLIGIFFYFFHNFLGSKTSNVYIFSPISLSTQIIMWSLIIGIFYRKYFSKGKMVKVVSEISSMLSKTGSAVV